MKEFEYSWDDQDPDQMSDLVEGEYDTSLTPIENHELDEDERYDDSGLCSCGDGGKHRECEACKHDLECRESHCDNQEHQSVVDFGYPELCTCFASKSDDTCLGCGHATSCDSKQRELCFTEPHSGILVFFLFPENCDCQDSHGDQKCPDCEHWRICAEAQILCRESKFHFEGSDGPISYSQNSNANIEQ